MNAPEISALEWLPSELEELNACPVCGNSQRNVLYTKLKDELFFCAPGHWSLYECGKCHVAYVDPRPDRASIAKAYTTYFTHGDPESPKQSNPGAAAHRLRAWIRAGINGYKNARWGARYSPAAWHGRAWIPLIWPLRSLIETQMRNLPNRPPRPEARLLDVGCGNGQFLRIAQEAGWKVQGIDFDPLAVAEARRHGIDVEQGGVEILAGRGFQFEWITCSHVVEHVHDSADLLTRMFNLLRPGGRLWIQTPNVESYGHEIFGRHWIGLDPPRHLAIFTLQALEALLKKAGFETRSLALPAISAMAVFAASETARSGDGMLAAVTPRLLLKPSFQLPAILQSLNAARSEFITIVATRPTL